MKLTELFYILEENLNFLKISSVSTPNPSFVKTKYKINCSCCYWWDQLFIIQNFKRKRPRKCSIQYLNGLPNGNHCILNSELLFSSLTVFSIILVIWQFYEICSLFNFPEWYIFCYLLKTIDIYYIEKVVAQSLIIDHWLSMCLMIEYLKSIFNIFQWTSSLGGVLSTTWTVPFDSTIYMLFELSSKDDVGF